MDSMVNRYTADRRLRHNDSYTPDGEGGKRPDRAVIVYAQRCREAFRDVPIVLGGIESSLRRIAHYDYWSDKVRRSILADAKADILLYGNAERAVVEVAHRLAKNGAKAAAQPGTAGVSPALPPPYPPPQPGGGREGAGGTPRAPGRATCALSTALDAVRAAAILLC